MEQSFLIFVAGSMLSYLPLYRLLDRHWVSRRMRRASNPPTDRVVGSRQLFLDSLRQEAALRARASVRAALATERAPKRAATAAAVNAVALKRLEETRGMIQTLLPADATALFDRIVQVCYATSATDRSELGTLIQQLDARLADVIGTNAIDPGGPSRAAVLTAPVAS